MFLTIVIFVIILIILILIHEFGHFMMAKINKVKVEEFAFGFPPRLFSIKRHGTRYSFNLIPLGGYVSLLDENEAVKVPGSYYSKKTWQKIIIVLTGVLMNFILAIIVLTIGFSVGMTPLVSDPSAMTGTKISQVMIIQVMPGTPAAVAQLETGNILEGFSTAADLQQFTRSHAGQSVDFQVRTNSHIASKTISLSQGEAPLGVGVISLTKVKQSLPRAFISATVEVGKSIVAVFSALGQMIKSLFTTGTAGEMGEGVVGPVGIYNFTASAVKIGWIYILQLLAILSINLGIINILPFPALDGGKILFLGLEGVFRKRVVRQEIENLIHTIGFIILIILVLAITLRDILRFR